MSNPGDAVRNSVTRRTQNNYPDEDNDNNYIPNARYQNEDSKREPININHVSSMESSENKNGEKVALLSKHSSSGVDEADAKFMKRDGLKGIHFTAYAVGHVYNDLCAT